MNIPWTLENSFDNPTRFFSIKIRNVFPQNLKTTDSFEDFVKKNFFFSKNVLWTQRKQFWPPCPKKLPDSKHFPSKLLVPVIFLEGNGNVKQEDPLNECRKQFFKLGGRLSGGSPQSSWSKLEKKCKSEGFLQKTNFPRKVLLFKWNAPLTTFLNFCIKVAELPSYSRKTVKKLKKNIEKTVHSKITFGYIDCNCDEPVESFYRTPKRFSFNFRKKAWIFSKEKDNLTQSFSLTQHFLTKVRKVFDQYSKKVIICILQNSKFPQKISLVHVKSVLTILLKPLRPSYRNFSSQPKDGEKIHNFP